MPKRCRTRRNLWPRTGCYPSRNHYQNHGFRRTIAHTVDTHFFARRCNYSREQDICSAAYASSDLYLQYGIMISASESDRQTVNSNLKWLAGWLAGFVGCVAVLLVGLAGLACWLGWLGWLAGCRAAWLADWLAAWLADWLAGWLAR